MKTVSFSFVSKFPAKKVVDCFKNPAFARVHTASNLFAKAGVIKADSKMIIRTLAITGAAKNAAPVVAVINFAEIEGGKSTAVSATFSNVPDNKAVPLKGLGKTINDEIAKFLAPKAPAVAAKKPVAKKAPAKKVAAKKPVAKKAPAKKATAKKPVAKKAPAKKVAAKKPVAKKAPAKKVAAKKPVAKKAPAKKAAAKKPVAKKAPAKKVAAKKPVAKKAPAPKPAEPKITNPITITVK